MSLLGKKVRIRVTSSDDKPYNLLGTIVLERGTSKMLVKLAKPLSGRFMASDTIELRPVYDNQAFSMLNKKGEAISVAGYLVKANNTRFDRIINGRVSIDERKRIRVQYMPLHQIPQNLRLNPACMIGLG